MDIETMKKIIYPIAIAYPIKKINIAILVKYLDNKYSLNLYFCFTSVAWKFLIP